MIIAIGGEKMILSLLNWMNNNQGVAEWMSGCITIIAVLLSLYLSRRSELIISKQRKEENYKNAYHSVLEALGEFGAATTTFTKNAELELINVQIEPLIKYQNLSDRPVQKYLKVLSNYSSKWENDWRLQFLVEEILTNQEYAEFSNIMNVELHKKLLLLKSSVTGQEVVDICFGNSPTDGINGLIAKLRSITIKSYNNRNEKW